MSTSYTVHIGFGVDLLKNEEIYKEAISLIPDKHEEYLPDYLDELDIPYLLTWMFDDELVLAIVAKDSYSEGQVFHGIPNGRKGAGYWSRDLRESLTNAFGEEFTEKYYPKKLYPEWIVSISVY